MYESTDIFRRWLPLLLGAIVAASGCAAELVSISVPLEIEKELIQDSPIAIEVQSEELGFAFDAAAPPKDRASVSGVSWGVVDAAKREDLEAFFKLSAPEATKEELTRDFGIYTSFVKDATVSFERVFFAGKVCVISAKVGGGKTVGGFIHLAELAGGGYGQNVALAYGPVPQAIQYAINRGNEISPPLPAEEAQVVRARFEEPKAAEVTLRRVFVRGATAHEILFKQQYGHELSVVCDEFVRILASIGTPAYESEDFGAESAEKIAAEGGVQRVVPTLDRRDLVSVISPTKFLVLTIGLEPGQYFYGYLSQGAAGRFRFVNFQRRAAAEPLLELPTVIQALAAHFDDVIATPVAEQLASAPAAPPTPATSQSRPSRSPSKGEEASIPRAGPSAKTFFIIAVVVVIGVAAAVIILRKKSVS